MAPRANKKSTKSTTKKQSTPAKKKVAKKSTTKKRVSPKRSSMKKNVFVVLGVFLMIGMVSLGYVLGKNTKTQPLPTTSKHKEHYSTNALLNDLAQLKVEKPKTVTAKPLPSKPKTKEQIITLHKKPIFQERGALKESAAVHKQAHKKVALAHRGKKPKLAIIIDDVHTKQQIDGIKKLGLKITPSIFPPYKLAKHSNLLANQVKHSMIHLPMESGNAQFNKQYKTLKRSFTDAQILARAKEIRTLFPHSKYINNHTGSVFTSDYKAMKKLYRALKEEGFVFIDSYTIASSKVKQIAHEFGDAYVRRDVFLDNKHTVAYIHNQLKLAVKKAKKNGYAVAIGHPHKTTMKALSSAKNILGDVELVYVDDIYKKVM